MKNPINERRYRVVLISDDVLRNCSQKTLTKLQSFMGFVVNVNYRIESRVTEYVVCDSKYDLIPWGEILPKFIIAFKRHKTVILFKWVKVNE